MNGSRRIRRTVGGADGDGETGTRRDLANVIRNGAKAYGGSSGMTAWGGVLSDQQVADLVAYVRQFEESS